MAIQDTRQRGNDNQEMSRRNNNESNRNRQNNQTSNWQGNQTNRNSHQNGGNNRGQQQGNHSQNGRKYEYTGPITMSCVWCNLVTEQGMPQECTRKGFSDRHSNRTDRNPFPNRCLPFMAISMDDRIKKLSESNVACTVCLQLFGIDSGQVGKSCGSGRHRNTIMRCATDNCENDALVCKMHERSTERNH